MITFGGIVTKSYEACRIISGVCWWTLQKYAFSGNSGSGVVPNKIRNENKEQLERSMELLEILRMSKLAINEQSSLLLERQETRNWLTILLKL